MSVLGYILIASFSLSFFSLLGIFIFALSKRSTEKILLFLVSLSAGTLMGGAFFHLMPEGAENLPIDTFFSIVLASFILFYFIEKMLRWRHCHDKNCEVHAFGYMNLIGDGIHNFIDGLIIAATFLIDIRLGIVTTIAIAFHEIPQEIGDFGVLLYAGFKKSKALILNFLIASIAMIGAIAGYFLSLNTSNVIIYLLPVAAGGFLYIATSDLIPEIRKEKDTKRSLLSFGIFLLGIAIMYAVKFI